MIIRKNKLLFSIIITVIICLNLFWLFNSVKVFICGELGVVLGIINLLMLTSKKQGKELAISILIKLSFRFLLILLAFLILYFATQHMIIHGKKVYEPLVLIAFGTSVFFTDLIDAILYSKLMIRGDQVGKYTIFK